MSIASEIARIRNNIDSAYVACSAKGAALPQTQNSANLAATVSCISTGIPVESRSFDQMNEKARLYIQNVAYDPSDYSSSQIDAYNVSTDYSKDRPAGAAINLPCAGVLTVSDVNRTAEYTVSSGNNTVAVNLTPGEAAVYVLRSNNGETAAAGRLVPTGSLRMIDAGGGTFNIRDLGGWRCDGGSLKYGMVFRGCELSGDNYNVNVNDRQIRFFTDYLGIRDEIDLRGNSEVDGDDEIYGTDDDITESVLGDAVDYIRCPVAPYAGGVDLSNPTQTAYYAALIKRIAADAAAGKPCYIHCMVGADRTGTLCALIEALCGVSQSDIDKDYELTSFARNNVRRRSGSDWTGFINRINSFTGSTFRDKAVDFALRAGVSIAEINALRLAMIDGTPSQLTSPYSPVTVTKSLTNVASDNTDNTAELFQAFTMRLMPSPGYIISGLQVLMDGTDITDGVFSGTEANLLRSVSKNLSNCSVNNLKSVVVDGEGYAAEILPSSGYTMEGATVTITMGGIDVSTNYKDGVIAIPRVTGNIVITASAVQQAAQNRFDPTAVSDSSRINSSGNAVAAAAGQLVTDFIPATASDIIRLVSDKTQDTNSYTGMTAFYRANKEYIGNAYDNVPAWSWNSNETDGTLDISAVNTCNVAEAAYVRFCIAYTDINNIAIYL